MKNCFPFAAALVLLAGACEKNELPVDPFEGVIETSDYVDLGLSVCWGSSNVGAASPEQAGSYFACGEDTVRVCYSTEDYIVAPGDTCFGYNAMTSKLDAVADNLGEGWSLPSAKQMMELSENCSVKYCSYKNTVGYAVTGPNGKSIFFPCAGYKAELNTFNNNNNPTYQAMYWSDVNGGIFYMRGKKITLSTDSHTFLGFPVRGVFSEGN